MLNRANGRNGSKAVVSFSGISHTSMPALTITIAFSFILGCLTSLGERRAYRFFNTATAGGAFLYAMALLLAFGTALLAIGLIGTVLGTYTRENDGAVLVSYGVGLSLLTVLDRRRSARR